MDVFAVLAEQPLLLALALPVAIMVAARPVWGIYWLIALVSMHRALYAVGVLSTGVKVLLDDGVVLAILFGSLVAAVRRRRLVPTEAAIPLAALLLIATVSLVANGTSVLTMVYGLRFSLLYSLLFLAIRNAPLDQRSVQSMISLAAATGSVNAAIAVAQFVGLLPLWSLSVTVEQLELGPFHRPTGLLGGPGDLGCYLVAIMCLLVVMGTPGAAPRRVRRLWLAAALVMGVGILCTASRGPIVAALVGVMVASACRARGRASLLLAALAFSSLALTVPVISQRFAFLPHEYELGRTNRAIYFYSGLQIWRSHPLFGVGMGMYGGAAGGHSIEALDDELGVKSQIDNYILGLLVQIGIVGVLAFLWLVVRIARRQLRIARECEGFPRSLAVAALTIMAAMVPLSLAGPSLEQHAFAIWFWTVPALAAVTAERARAVAVTEGETDEAAARVVAGR